MKRPALLLVIMALLLMAPIGTALGQSCSYTYTVQAGDNLFRIALNNGLTTNQLAAQNGITNSTLIYVGQVLAINTCSGGAVAGTSGGTTSSTATTYTVQPGDNLFRIALRYGLTTTQLASYNGISNTSLIYVGQVLAIPGVDGGSTGGTGYSNVANVDTLAPTNRDYTEYEASLLRVAWNGRSACGGFTLSEGTHFIQLNTYPGCAAIPAENLTVACYDPNTVLGAGGSAGWTQQPVGAVEVFNDTLTDKQELKVTLNAANLTCGIFRR